MSTDDDRAAAAAVLDKLRGFIDTLDDRERATLGALLAPGVALAFADGEVVGFSAEVDWWPGRLPEALADEVRDRHVAIHIDPV